MHNLAVVVMAAGQGTRMEDPERAKVLFEVGGRPMVGHVLDRALEIEPDRVIVVTGYRSEDVEGWVEDHFDSPKIYFAEQEEQLGTAHAVMQAIPDLEDLDGDVLVLSGDVPLLKSSTLRGLLETHRQKDAAATLLTVTAEDPTGYGRIIRNDDGSVDCIVEEKDASDAQKAVTEVNSGVYAFKIPSLLQALPEVENDNEQKEYYLPDVIRILSKQESTIAGVRLDDENEVRGVNDREQLAEVDKLTSRVDG